jgi:hypothetical protein
MRVALALRYVELILLGGITGVLCHDSSSQWYSSVAVRSCF